MTVSAPDPIETVDQRISAAWQSLKEAGANYEHSPNGQNLKALLQSERDVDFWLDTRNLVAKSKKRETE